MNENPFLPINSEDDNEINNDLAKRIREKFPDQNDIKVNDDITILKMMSGIYTIDGTPFHECPDSVINTIKDFLDGKKADPEGENPFLLTFD